MQSFAPKFSRKWEISQAFFAKNGVNIFAKIMKFHENKKFREKRIEIFLEPVSAIQLSFYRGFCGENRI